MVVVPVESGLALTAETGEEALLNLMQQVEADEQVVVVLEVDAIVLGHLTVEGSLVGQSLTLQVVVILAVDVGHMGPQAQESLLELALVVGAEVGEKLADGVALAGRQVACVVELVEIAQVGENLSRRCHVLVDIVEVAEQQLAPAEEVVDGLLVAGDARVDLMEVADELDVVGHLQLAVTAEEVADGDVGGRPQGTASLACQGVVEEERGALVGKDDGQPLQVGAVLLQDIVGYVFEEGGHFF